jgi:transposase
MNGRHERDLSDEQWAFVLPLLPPGRVRHTPRGRMRTDRSLFAVIAFIIVRERPWTAGVDYGVSARTLQQQWTEYHQAGVFTRMENAANGRTATGQWALLVARTSNARAARFGYVPADPPLPAGPSEDDYRRAWQLQNLFPET